MKKTDLSNLPTGTLFWFKRPGSHTTGVAQIEARNGDLYAISFPYTICSRDIVSVAELEASQVVVMPQPKTWLQKLFSR